MVIIMHPTISQSHNNAYMQVSAYVTQLGKDQNTSDVNIDAISGTAILLRYISRGIIMMQMLMLCILKMKADLGNIPN